MPKISDLSKFDFQSIVNSVKSIISSDSGTPKVPEGDLIGSKMVTISTLLQEATKHQEQAARDLTQVNNLINELYKDLELFRKLQEELKKQEAELAQAKAAATAAPAGSEVKTTAEPSTTQTTATSDKDILGERVGTSSSELKSSGIDIKAEDEALKKKDQSPFDPTRGTSKPSDHD
jgi:hypothetical protein